LTPNFSATNKDLKLKIFPAMKNLMLMKPQKRKSENIDHRIFPNLFPKNWSVPDGTFLMGHCDFIKKKRPCFIKYGYHSRGLLVLVPNHILDLRYLD
jgi:hypothetical protein